MIMNDNIKLYDAKGKEIKISPIKTVSRKEVAFNVFNYHMKSDDRDTFFALLAQYVPIDENGKMEIPMDDENIQNTLIGYASTSVINRALDEDLMQAYSLLFTYTDPKKFNDDTTVMVTEDLLK